MPRWVRYWLVCSITYATPVALVVASQPHRYAWWPVNWLVVAGPPVALGLLLAGAVWLLHNRPPN